MQVNFRILITLFTIILFSAKINAQQTEFKPYIGIGVHGGINYSDIEIDQAINNSDISYGKIQNTYMGFVLIFMAEEYAGIQIEANLAKNGWEEVRDTAYTYTRTMNYIEVPVLTHLSFGKKRMRYVIDMGPYVSFYRDTEESLELFPQGSYNSETDTSSYIGKPVNNKIDLGFMLDAGIGINTSIGIFHVKARYSYGIINLFNKYPEGIYQQSQFRNYYFGVSYQYNFYFAGKE